MMDPEDECDRGPNGSGFRTRNLYRSKSIIGVALLADEANIGENVLFP
jgi:hypothetical protein